MLCHENYEGVNFIITQLKQSLSLFLSLSLCCHLLALTTGQLPVDHCHIANTRLFCAVFVRAVIVVVSDARKTCFFN